MATLNRAFALYGASCHVPKLLQVATSLALARDHALELRALALLLLLLALQVPLQALQQQGLQRGVLLAPSRQAGSC